MVQEVPPAVLPGTVKDFPFSAEKLISMAHKLFFEDEVGVKNPDALAEDFRFEFPIVKLDKKAFLKAVGTFNLKEAFPNYTQNPYDWRVDKYEPQRVWFTVRTTGTHLNDLKIFHKYTYKATGKVIYGAPEAYSLTFNSQGLATSITGGYVMDNRVGNSNNLGALFGILSGLDIFVPHPQPGTLGWTIGSAVDTSVNLVKTVFHFMTFKIFKGGKPKSA